MKISEAIGLCIIMAFAVFISVFILALFAAILLFYARFLFTWFA